MIPIEITCQDQSCKGMARFTEEISSRNGKFLLQGYCMTCLTDQMIVYSYIQMKATHRCIEIEKTRVLDGETLKWSEYRTNDDKLVGWDMDGAVRVDMGPFHLANDRELEMDEDN